MANHDNDNDEKYLEQLETFKRVYADTRDQREAMAHVPAGDRLMFMSQTPTVEAIRAIDAQARQEDENRSVEDLEAEYRNMVGVLTKTAKTEGDVKAAQAAISAIQWQLAKANPGKYGDTKKETPSVAVQVNTGPVTLKTPTGETKELVFNVGD